MNYATRYFTKFTLCAAAAWALFSADASAGSATNVTILSIEVESQGDLFIYLSGNITGGPACGSSDPNGFVVDGSTAGGKVMVALIQVAYTLGKTVSATGTNVCDLHPVFETLFDIRTTN